VSQLAQIPLFLLAKMPVFLLLAMGISVSFPACDNCAGRNTVLSSVRKGGTKDFSVFQYRYTLGIRQEDINEASCLVL